MCHSCKASITNKDGWNLSNSISPFKASSLPLFLPLALRPYFLVILHESPLTSSLYTACTTIYHVLADLCKALNERHLCTNHHFVDIFVIFVIQGHLRGLSKAEASLWNFLPWAIAHFIHPSTSLLQENTLARCHRGPIGHLDPILCDFACHLLLFGHIILSSLLWICVN